MADDDDDEDAAAAADADEVAAATATSEPSAKGETAEDGTVADVESLVGVPTDDTLGSEAAAAEDDELPCADAVVDVEPTELGDAKDGSDEEPRSKGEGGTDDRDLADGETWKHICIYSINDENMCCIDKRDHDENAYPASSGLTCSKMNDLRRRTNTSL